MSTTATTVLYQAEAGVATLTLNRPESLNALTGAMHGELRAALARAAGDPEVRCLVLTGAGRGFCSGADLTDSSVIAAGGVPDLAKTLETTYNPLIRALRDLPKPIVAAVNGVAAGAGANIALSCDLVLAARSALFIQAFCKIGLIPDAGGTWLLPRHVGRARAAGLALLGDKLPAEQAEAWGLIWKVVDDDKLADEAAKLAGHLATQPTTALGLIKKALAGAETNTLDAQLDLERDLQTIAGRTDDFREGVAAFREKRPTRFTGR
ncbi:MAG: 2-(1,2-epoxy-1,2-dihydrophenyl)acetyl-CoA isomerase [Alphaproteobacteria bacterium]|nr:2-(1,2-epoxy-1,2-dihydrophenyl)acetyl-CoA isomerase [Alphaproteobacteria bacterium]